MKNIIVIGTRSSKLALWQTNFVKDKLKELFPDIEILIKEIKTKGDHILDVALSKIGDKGLFTKELEDALLNNEIDLAVHSLKDLPTKLPDGLIIGAIPERENPCDALLSNGIKLDNIIRGSKIGTSSLRRIAQLKSIRPDLDYLDLRGNLDTRIRKLEEEQYDGIILAYAGVKRLGLAGKISELFNPKEILPAVGQGALAIEIRSDDERTKEIVSRLNHKETFMCTTAERIFLEKLHGGCQTPIGAYTEVINGVITLYGMVASLDGKNMVKNHTTCKLEINECKLAGENLAKTLLEMGGKEILDCIIR